MEKIKITQVKSIIDRPKNQKETIKALGLARPHSVVIKEVNPAIMGMVKKVSHLISVEKI